MSWHGETLVDKELAGWLLHTMQQVAGNLNWLARADPTRAGDIVGTTYDAVFGCFES